ncbi:hypothetical protein HaLaN_23484, partial [Haematococcus lacustris]
MAEPADDVVQADQDAKTSADTAALKKSKTEKKKDRKQKQKQNKQQRRQEQDAKEGAKQAAPPGQAGKAATPVGEDIIIEYVSAPLEIEGLHQEDTVDEEALAYGFGGLGFAKPK